MKNLLKTLLVVASISTVMAAPTLPFTPAVGPSTGELQFDGTIAPSCNLQSFVDGIIVANLDQTQLDSTLSGGLPAKVNTRANVNGYTLHLGDAYLIDPNGAKMSDVTISTSAIANGKLLNGNPVAQFGPDAAGIFYFDGGIYQMEVNANATRAQGSAFQAGVYILRVPVSCV